MSLWGLDCQNPACVHDSVTGYRLHLLLHRSAACTKCGQLGGRINGTDIRLGAIESGPPAGTFACVPCGRTWEAGMVPERHDLLFRANQLDSALAQMAKLGNDDPKIGEAFFLPIDKDRHGTLPDGCTGRLMRLTAEALPRTALYFRWEPMANEILTPDRIFQCVFLPGDTAQQRSSAAQVRLADDACAAIVSGGSASVTMIPCQHCHKPIALRSFNTLHLREVELGD